MEKYWEKTVLLMVPTWKKALKKADDGWMNVGDEVELRKAPASLSWYSYSKDYEARLKKAGLKP